jgi:hypothetical protein
MWQVICLKAHLMLARRTMDLLAQSAEIALRYSLIPQSIDQSNMMDYLSEDPERNFIRYNRILQPVTEKHGRGDISTASICSYMNPYTPNKRLALIHSTGTGKTRKSLLAAMQYNRDITLVAVHSVQLSPFTFEMRPGGVVDRLYPWFKKRIDVITCKSVSSAVDKGDRRRLDFLFKGRVIIVDEMHHIRNNAERPTSRVSLFDSMIDVLSEYEDSIVFFLTATPLVDSATELIGIYKLLRPGLQAHGNMQHLAYDLRGYISSLKTTNLRATTVEVKCLMHPDGAQWRLYQKHQHDKSSVYSRTMAVSRFITLDDDDASEYPAPIHAIMRTMVDRSKFSDDDTYNDACIEALKYISVKLYCLVLHLKSHRGYPKFIFDAWKKRGGVERIVDVLCMPAVGYRCITEVSEAMDRTRGPKILALHRIPNNANKSSTTKQLIDIYNSEANRYGDLIDLLIAAPMFAESMSLITAMESHIMMPPWNVTSATQVLGRVNRKSSLWYLPVRDRHVTNYIYVLYKPDSSETVESKIADTARLKHREITPLLRILRDSSIETLYHDHNGKEFPIHMVDAAASRVNTRVRMTRVTIGYREIAIGVDKILEELEKRDNVYRLMGDIVSQESGYTRLVNVAIQAIEQVYMRQMFGEPITQKQANLLSDISPAFIKYQEYHMHVLYFSNDDTVEYQRLTKTKRRIVRVVDTDNRMWVDVVDKGVVNMAARRYEDIATRFSESIQELWCRYGFYVVKFLLTSCYRLVKYRTMDEIAKHTRGDKVDRRKVSRGEKWQYYSKDVLLDVLCKFINLTRVQKLIIRKRASVQLLFNHILHHMTANSMVLTLPI